MKTTPLVSIIVPIYNTAEYLPACLDSIINQTYQNLEIILIDDGSTDNSREIANNYTKKDPRIKLVHQKNQGLSAARNTGIKNTTGQYITFVDSDDKIESQMIENMLNAIQKTNANIVCCSFKEIFPNGKQSGFNQKYPEKIYNTESALEAMLLEHGFMLSATMKLFPSDYFNGIKFPTGKLHEDIGTTYKLIMKAPKITFIPNQDYIYVHHEDSITNKSFDIRKLDIIELTDKMCDDIDTKYPDLKNVTNERRMRARFSILRQIPLSHPKTKEMINYIKTNRTYIANNPISTKTDRLALRLAIINPRLFQYAYKIFKS